MNNTIKAVLLAVMLAAVCASVMVTEAVDAADGSGDVAEGDATGTPVAQVGDETFATLQEAFDKGKDSATPVTIELLRDFTGPGVKVQSGSNVILDFNGYTYTNNGGIGSTGTETNGFQLLRDSTVVFKNGTLTAVSSPACQILVQNYCDLTLDNMELNASTTTGYVVSNNYGSLTITNGTGINASSSGYAFDLYYWPSNTYVEGMTVTVEDGTINGNIQYGTDNTETAKDFFGKAVLRINGGSFNGNIETYALSGLDPDISITGGTFSSDVSAYVAEGYKQVGNVVGKIQDTVDTSKPEVSVESDSNSVVVAVEEEVSNATVGATVNASGTASQTAKVEMTYNGSLTTAGIAMSATVVAPEDVPVENIGNPVTVYDLVVNRGTNNDRYTLTVTVTLDIPAGMTLSGAYVMFYEDGKEPERYTPEVDGATVTFTTTHNTYYAVYGDVVEAGSGSHPSWDDDEDLPPFIPTQPAEDDNTVTIVACAAAAAVAAIMAVFLIIDRKG